MTIDREQLLSKLSSLPDYPALRDVADALWGAGEIRGAAVMVGSGYSRYCEQTAGDAAAPPLWGDFARRMAADLYPPGSGKENGDPLRLAAEYRAALGQPALDALIRQLVPDRRWLPGSMHRELLRLPWADVLTTNWDTLLERAAAEHHERLYETRDAGAANAPGVELVRGNERAAGVPGQRRFAFTTDEPKGSPRSLGIAPTARFEHILGDVAGPAQRLEFLLALAFDAGDLVARALHREHEFVNLHVQRTLAQTLLVEDHRRSIPLHCGRWSVGKRRQIRSDRQPHDAISDVEAEAVKCSEQVDRLTIGERDPSQNALK